MLADLVLALLIALAFVLIFGAGFRRAGPWESLWSFFLVVFLAALALGAWVEPVGPVAWGVAWVPLLVGAFFVALLLAAATPIARRPPAAGVEPRAGEAVAAGVFLWMLLLGLLLVFGAAFLF